jgi:hypothetical protein
MNDYGDKILATRAIKLAVSFCHNTPPFALSHHPGSFMIPTQQQISKKIEAIASSFQ